MIMVISSMLRRPIRSAIGLSTSVPRTSRLDLDARLHEGDVDVEDVEEGEDESCPDDPDEQVRQRPDVDPIEPRGD